ncbi:MAG: class I SAM-dependent methyltransferase [bacterium]
MKQDYYQETLAADKLKRCYEIAPLRIKQYLEAEIQYVLKKINEQSLVLELGCGYGRVLARLAERARFTVGIDTSYASLSLCQETMKDISNYALLNTTAIRTGLRDRSFDSVVCIQNGISAFHVDERALVRESIRITKPGGTILFSSYADKFWQERLKWFQIQADAGLLGEIDLKTSRDGIIVSKDGFTARTVRPHDFEVLVSGFDVEATITEVDGSSIFCEIKPH